MFCSIAKGSLFHFVPILYSESFTLFKEAVYNGLSLELNTPSNFQLRTSTKNQQLCIFLILKYQVLVDKQMCFEIHHYL